MSNERKDDPSTSRAPPERRAGGEGPRPISNRGVAIFFAMLAAALVLGYLFLNKLTEMSREEDCALAHRQNCGAVVAPGR